MNTAADVDSDCEQTWVEKAREDSRALEHLYNLYFPRIYAYVYARLGSVQDCEDVVADTFLKAVTGIKQFRWRHEGSFAAWLFRIAHNAVTDYRRRARARGDPLPLNSLLEIHSGTTLPEDVALQKERFARLHRLIAALSPRRQEVITLRFLGELSNIEIAAVLELDERTVASHLCRGLRDLHERWLEELDTEST
jgi:RNA polymerase sigma-70 factor, ECF subfamily